MYLDIESRRGDARDASVDSVNRLEQTWLLFKDLEPKLIVNDEAALPRAEGPVRFPVRVRCLTSAAVWRGGDPRPAQGLDLKAEAASLRETVATAKGQKQQRAIKRLKVVSAFTPPRTVPSG